MTTGLLSGMLEGAEIIDVPANEYVYQLPTEIKHKAIRIYSSVDKATGKTRDKGADAIRVIAWDALNDRPLGKGKKILRVEGATSIKERIANAVAALTAQNDNIVNFDYVRAILTNGALGANGFVNSLLANLDKYGRLTDKQLAYVLGDMNPKGLPTFEAQVKKADPDFYTKWVENAANFDAEDKETPKTEAMPQNPPQAKLAPTAGDSVDLIPTKDYPDYQYPFEQFNPVQSLVMPHRAKDINMVIGANTSAGKTICAELIMDAVLKQGRRVIYLSPLKALTDEKYEDWQKRFSDYNVAILTGDYTLSEEKKQKLADSQIIVMTSEMADSRTRRMHTEKNFWLLEVGLVIVDEAHILATSRGHAVETGIMRFTKLNRRARIVFLSATMPNVDELGTWLTKLNGKQTEVIYCDWRPVDLDLNIVGYQTVTRVNGYPDYKATQALKRQTAIDIIEGKPKEKFLVFVHDKTTGRMLANEIEKRLGEIPQFHNADLNKAERDEIEKSFRNKKGGLRIMISTSTTAWGVNLPARNVIIVGVHRGIQEVDDYDIIQMAGRAGRYGIDDEGHVYLIVPSEEIVAWHKRFSNPRPIVSTLKHEGILGFHVLAEINNGEIRNPNDAIEWYKRSLGIMQGIDFYDEDAERLFKALLDMDMIRWTKGGDRVYVTGLGKVSAWLYFNPYDVYSWFHNFRYFFENGLDDNDLALAWALGDVHTENLGYVPKPIAYEAEKLAEALRAEKIRVGDTIHKVLAYHACITGQDNKNALLGALMRGCKYDIRRIVQALNLIDTMYAKWDKGDFWAVLADRVIYGIPAEMAELVKLPGVGGKTATRLWKAGFRGIADIAKDANKRKMRKVFRSPKTMHKVIEAAKGMV